MNATITLYVIVLVTGDIWNVLNIHLIFLISFALLNKFTVKIAPLLKSLCCIHRHTCFVRLKFWLLLMNTELFHCQIISILSRQRKKKNTGIHLISMRKPLWRRAGGQERSWTRRNINICLLVKMNKRAATIWCGLVRDLKTWKYLMGSDEGMRPCILLSLSCNWSSCFSSATWQRSWREY